MNLKILLSVFMLLTESVRFQLKITAHIPYSITHFKLESVKSSSMPNFLENEYTQFLNLTQKYKYCRFNLPLIELILDLSEVKDIYPLKRRH